MKNKLKLMTALGVLVVAAAVNGSAKETNMERAQTAKNKTVGDCSRTCCLIYLDDSAIELGNSLK